jgi:outer membrane receptor protein involved in Fe transport
VSQAPSIVEALNDLPGVKISMPGNGTDGHTFLQRGLFGNNYTKFLLDDVAINPVVVSGMPLAEQVNMRNVERIEVVYGPAAAIYGADAVGGVINIISKKPKETTAKVGTKMARNFSYQNAYGSYALGSEECPLNVDLYGLYTNRKDWDIYQGYQSLLDRKRYPLGDVITSPEDFSNVGERNWSAGLKVRTGSLTVAYDHLYRRSNSTLGQIPSWYFYDDPNAIWGETIQRAMVKHEASSGDFGFSSRVSYLKNRLDPKSYFSFIFPTDNPATFGQRNRAYKFQASDEATLEELVTWTPNTQLEVVTGLQYSHQGFLPKSNDLPSPFSMGDYEPFQKDLPPASPIFGNFGWNPKVVNQWGAFTQATYTISDWVLLGGIRFDSNSRFGSATSPRIAARYNLSTATSFTASVGRAFKAPNPYREFGNSVAVLNPDGTINYFGVPNPGGVRPERFVSYEVGGRHIWNSKVSTEVTVYMNQLKNLLSDSLIPLDPVLYPNGGNTQTSTVRNDGDATVKYWGGDFVVHMRDLVPAVKLGSDIFVTYVNGTQTFPGTSGTISDMQNQPHWITKWRLSAEPIQKLIVGVDNVWYSSHVFRGILSKSGYDTDPNTRVNGDYVVDV